VTTETVSVRELMVEMRERFTSGNAVPVERATIKRTEWDALEEMMRQWELVSLVELVAENCRLRGFIESEFFKRVTYKQENETLRERNAWLENYVKACDNEIKRAYARTAPDVPATTTEGKS